MSQTYVIQVTETLRRHVHVADGIETRLTLLDILDAGRMAELLDEELATEGFELAEDGTRVKTEGDVHVRVDPSNGTVTVGVASVVEVDLERSAGGLTRASVEEGEAQLRAETQRRLERDADQLADEARQELTRRLEAQLSESLPQLDRITNRTLARALEERAAQLGEITEIQRDDETGEVTIRVRV